MKDTSDPYDARSAGRRLRLLGSVHEEKVRELERQRAVLLVLLGLAAFWSTVAWWLL